MTKTLAGYDVVL